MPKGIKLTRYPVPRRIPSFLDMAQQHGSATWRVGSESLKGTQAPFLFSFSAFHFPLSPSFSPGYQNPIPGSRLSSEAYLVVSVE